LIAAIVIELLLIAIPKTVSLMLEQLLEEHVVSKVDALLVHADQLPTGPPWIVAEIHFGARVRYACGVVPRSVDVEIVFSNLIALVVAVFVCGPQQLARAAGGGAAVPPSIAPPRAFGGAYCVESINIKNCWCKNPSDPDGCLCKLSHATVSLVDENGVASTNNTCGMLNVHLPDLNPSCTINTPSSSPASATSCLPIT
jgi:hypothetical protein